MANTKRRSRLERVFIRLNRALRGRTDSYLARRPHRSFRRTRRRDYVRSLALPGYVGLTRKVFGIIFRNWRLFGAFFVLYSLASVVILGIANQQNYSEVAQALRDSASNDPLRILTLFGAAITGGFNPSGSADTGVIGTLLVLLAWLVLIYLLRHVVNDRKVTLREGLYSAGAPLIPTALIAFVVVVQLVPVLLALIMYSAAANANLLSFGIEAMLVYGAGFLLLTMSLYWLTSTFIALIIVTLPGMYPWAALRAAGDLVIGRRLRVLLRLAWLAGLIVLVWAVILIPAILIDDATRIAWLPLVPITILGLTTFTLILASTYIYTLYRAMVDDGAKPA